MKRGTPDHPKTFMLAMELEKVYAAHRKKSSFGGKSEAVGVLETLWDWASKYAIQGDIGKWPDDVIAHGIGWLYSGKELISALITSRWVDVAPEPFRLTIHDIQDHAQNCWRQNLENAGLTWWDGTPARKYKLQKSPKSLQEKSNYTPQPEPETKPETEQKQENPQTPAPQAALVLDSPGTVRPTVPTNGNGKRHKPEMSAQQRQWFGRYLEAHPKNTVQVVSAENLWREKVHTEELAEKLIETLKRESVGDHTFIFGPGKWLADHLALYANGVEAKQLSFATAAPARAAPRSTAGDRALALMAERLRNGERPL